MSPEQFADLLRPIIATLDGATLDDALEAKLDQDFPHDGDVITAIDRACDRAIEDGWMCKHEAGGIRYGRVIRPGTLLGNFSVDVVLMENVVGPKHIHPTGEVDLILPRDGHPVFDGKERGFKVYAPASSHSPTVSGGKALVLYLLPEGAIDFRT